MKKLMFALGIALLSVPVFARPTMLKMSNAHGKTTFWISVPDEDMGDSHSLRMENFVFHNNGQSYKAEKVLVVKKASVAGKTTLKMSFKKFTEFNDCALSFTLNGQDQGFLNVERNPVWFSGKVGSEAYAKARGNYEKSIAVDSTLPYMTFFSNGGGKTTIRFAVPVVEGKSDNRPELGNFILHNKGKSYQGRSAKSVWAESNPKNVNVEVCFKRFTVYKDCRLSFLMNGEERFIDIQRRIERIGDSE
ncbi:MAG: hypothetical protein NC048_08985 [Bacteroides sp.]|nr:hypothetical protein [Ruminococcus flavefaciens]MCM1555611.1 hypothetical protein [Bacteroides sp.]